MTPGVTSRVFAESSFRSNTAKCPAGRRTLPRATLRLCALCAGVLLMSGLECGAQESSGRNDSLFCVGLVGQGTAGQNKVLLRWYSTSGELPFSQFSIYRKSGGPHDPGTYAKLSSTERLRNIALIRSLFERPGEERILADILDVLNGMADDEVTVNTYATRLLEILDETDTCDSCAARSSLLVQSNYGVAIVEGLGYLDRVSPGTYTYELRTSTGADEDNLLLGRVTVDASTITTLPAPSNPEEVEIEGLRGDRKVFLRWDTTAALDTASPIGFGFNVYRYDGHLGASDTFETLMSAGQLTQVNRLPIMLGGATVEERSEDEQYDFMDDNLDFDRIERKGTKFTAGQPLTYWVAARDLLGQYGTPTAPLDVIVQDRQAPPIPRELQAVEERVGPNRRIVLQWNSNADGDTTAYELYRYLYYQHAGRFGPPFADDAELPAYRVTEGLLAAVPEPSSATVAYRDTEISVAKDESRAYWYCVAALDAAGNRSPLSPPVRGVLYDRTAPDPPTAIDLCTFRFRCETTFDHESTKSDPGKTVVVFHVERGDPRIREARVVRNDSKGSKILYDGPFGTQTTLKIADKAWDDSAPSDDDIGYLFWFRTPLGEWCGPHVLPYDMILALLQSRSSRINVRVKVDLAVAKICVDGLESERIPHDPVAEGNTGNPLEITVALMDDAVGAILYRAQDCTEFQRIGTERAEEGDTSVTLVDTLRPGSVAVMCYGVRLFDENQNLSGMTYLEAHVIFQGDDTVQPTIDSVTALGTASAPEARVKWFGPEEGVSGYRLSFVTGTVAKMGYFASTGMALVGSATGVSTVYPVDELSYQESSGLWSVRTSTLDDLGNIPLAADTSYRIWVEGIDHLGNTVEGRSTYRFTWSREVADEERLVWPVRPLPDQTGGPNVFSDKPDADGVVRGLAIELTDPDHSPYQEVNPLTIIEIATPFVVYRKRVDITGQPYVQIGPLIEEINTDASGTIQDPFILAFGTAAYYMDYVGLVHGAKYRYVIVELDETGELSLVRGPTSDVEVTFE